MRWGHVDDNKVNIFVKHWPHIATKTLHLTSFYTPGLE